MSEGEGFALELKAKTAQVHGIDFEELNYTLISMIKPASTTVQTIHGCTNTTAILCFVIVCIF